MRRILTLVFMGLLAVPAMATDGAELAPLERWQAEPTQVFEAVELNPDDFLWIARPVVVFADTPADPRYKLQMDFLLERLDALAERDVIVVTDTDPAAKSAFRELLRPRGFMLVIVGKDGKPKLRKPAPWDVREITRSIDKMPLRQQEMQDERLRAE